MENKFSKLISECKTLLINYPFVLLLSLLATIFAISNVGNSNFTLTRLTFTSCLGISLFLGIRMFQQRFGYSIPSTIIGVLGLVGFYFLLPNSENQFTHFYFFLLAPIYLLSHLWVAIAPFLTGEKKDFWEYNKNLFINLVSTLIFTTVLTLGLFLAVFAVDQLFNITINNSFYQKLFLFTGIFGSSFIYLLFIGNGLKKLETSREYPNILQVFTQFILIPLLLIYAVILYLYSGKILVQWELPKGWVSYLVLIYSVVGILAFLLVYPLLNTAKSWVKIFSKSFFFSLIPLLILLYTAILVRLSEYGFTEPRYYVLMLTIWISFITLYFCFSKASSLQIIPKSLAIATIFSLACPYFNAFSTSLRSQKSQIEKMVKEKNLLQNGTLNFQAKIDNDTAEAIASKISFFSMRSKTEQLQALFSTSDWAALNQSILYPSTVKSMFTDIRLEKDNYYRVTLSATNTQIEVSGYQFVAKSNMDNIILGKDTLAIKNTLSGEEKKFIIHLNTTESIDITPQIKALMSKVKSDQKVPEITIENHVDQYHFKIYFDFISLYNEDNGKSFYNTGDWIILIKK